MPVLEWRSTMPVNVETLREWHARAGALERLTPPWQKTCAAGQGNGTRGGASGETSGGTSGETSDWIGGEANLVDRPFAVWHHRRRFVARSEHESVMEDYLEFKLPFAGVGAIGNGRMRRELERIFRFRHERLRHDLERHAAFCDRPRLKVAVAGASGMVGSQFCSFLTSGGHEVRRLVRRTPASANEVHWDPARGEIDAAALAGLDAVVNLAGENIGQRWSPQKRIAIKASREQGTALLAQTLASLDAPAPALVNTSAVGYYGAGLSDAVLDEDSPAGNDYLAEVCLAWEGATATARESGVRVVTPRFGVVMSAREGALAKQLRPYRLGAGGPVGSGKQWLSWVAPDDLVAIIYTLLYDNELSGVVNAVAPQPVVNREFARVLGRVVRRPAVLPLPALAVRGLFGEMGEVMLLRGQRVVPMRLQTNGFRWYYPDLEGALRFELGQGTDDTVQKTTSSAAKQMHDNTA